MCESINSVKLCKCGCKQKIVIKSFHKYSGVPDYINGHYMMTDESKKRLSDIHADPNSKYNSKEYRKKIAMGGHNRINTKEYRGKLSKALMGNTNQDIEKMKKGFQKWKNNNLEKHIEHQREAGREGGIVATELQTKRGFVSKPEKIMKSWLPSDFLHGIRFGRFVPDFRSDKRRIIIEVDGVHWHSTPERIKSDKNKDIFYKNSGYKIYRFTDIDIIKNPKSVKQQLESFVGVMK